MKAILALENGLWFQGESAGASGQTQGEVVFNTNMTGYQEVLTDPSYTGQIVTMTCPQIGNYGVVTEDVESQVPRVSGFVMREESPIASNWRATGTLRDYLEKNEVVAISGIDTRALTRIIRTTGVMRGVIGIGPVEPDELIAEARNVPKIEGRDMVSEVTCAEPFEWSPQDSDFNVDSFSVEPARRPGRPLRIAAYDFGMKLNILRRFAAYDCVVSVFPARTPAVELLAGKPDGVFLSNGPGDPSPLAYAVENARALIEANVPTFGICLGHQILGLAMGARTYKLKFGHRGGNHPVKNLMTERVEITSQNHGFAVDPKSLSDDVSVTHVNLYDGTIEGLRHKSRPVFCVQYHPEASPGPHDADYLFSLFLDEMERRSVSSK